MSPGAPERNGKTSAGGAHHITRAELLEAGQQTARGILDAEEALDRVRGRFEQTDDPQAQGELAAEALDHVERQLDLTRERRRVLDGVGGTLWARRNRLERFLIGARGTAWWHARRDLARAEAAEAPS